MVEDHVHGENSLEQELSALISGYAESLAAPRAEIRRQPDKFLLFSVGESVFGLPIGDLLQIIPAKDLVRAPLAQANLAGAVAFRQEIISVLHLRPILGIEGSSEQPGESWILVLRPLSRRAAFAVDSLTALHRGDARALERAPFQSPHIAGKFCVGDVPVSILDVNEIISTNFSATAGA